MGSLEEIYWNMAKKQWKVGTHYAIMPSCDGNYLINNTLYMRAYCLPTFFVNLNKKYVSLKSI